MRFLATVLAASVLLCSLDACAQQQTSPQPAPAPSAKCPPPSEASKVADLTTKIIPDAVTVPMWGSSTAWLIPSDNPITLRLTFPAPAEGGAAGFAVAGKPGEAPWQTLAVQSWQAKGDQKGGDLVVEPIEDGRVQFWDQRLHLVVAFCAGGKLQVGQTSALVSPRLPAVLAALAITVLLYVFAAWSIPQKDLTLWQRLHPLRLAIDGSGRASLSQMQIIFFSVIVLYLVTYILLRTGILASLSDNVLLLLGFTAGGSVLGQLATNQTQRLSYENWAWMQRKGWMADGGLHVPHPSWSDLFCTNDVFDPYRFQMASFSVVIGVSLLMLGASGLADFSVPQSLLVVVGLSQGAYIGGKITNPGDFTALDTLLKNVRDAQAEFLAMTADKWVPLAPPGPAREAQLIEAEKDRRDKYIAFKTLVCPAYTLFRTLFKTYGDEPRLEPDPPC